MSRLVWLHEDMLRFDHPVFSGADDKAFFVWDDDYFQKMDYSLKRRVFIYETLAEMKVDIIKGKIPETVIEGIEYYDYKTVHTAWTPNPHLSGYMGQIAKNARLEIIRDIPFVHFEKQPDLKRFFRYWNKARKKAMKPTQEATSHE